MTSEGVWASILQVLPHLPDRQLHWGLDCIPLLLMELFFPNFILEGTVACEMALQTAMSVRKSPRLT